MSKVIVGSDHAGFDFKKKIIDQLKAQTIAVEDVGTYSKESCDYPDPAIKVAEAVSEGKAERGVLICGSGIGMSIVANRFPGVRAALVQDVETARLSRLHNNANVLILGERVLNPQQVPEILSVWFETGFEGGRHQRRLDKIEALEKKLYK
ncbi:MAG: ribose 5-phosphate isomerase B [Nitrospiria bacterium]